MTVYVDNAQIPYGRMRMCHMLADSLDELHAMADHLGLQRRWFQGRASCPHYDVCRSKRQRAVAAGAVEIDRKQLAQMLPRLRRALFADMANRHHTGTTPGTEAAQSCAAAGERVFTRDDRGEGREGPGVSDGMG